GGSGARRHGPPCAPARDPRATRLPLDTSLRSAQGPLDDAASAHRRRATSRRLSCDAVLVREVSSHAEPDLVRTSPNHSDRIDRSEAPMRPNRAQLNQGPARHLQNTLAAAIAVALL